MKETELKPCRCGATKLVVVTDKVPILFIPRWRCMIACADFICGNEVTECGFTKRGAYKKAVKAWNRKVGHDG